MKKDMLVLGIETDRQLKGARGLSTFERTVSGLFILNLDERCPIKFVVKTKDMTCEVKPGCNAMIDRTRFKIGNDVSLPIKKIEEIEWAEV